MMKTSPAGPKRPSKSSRAGYDVPFHLSRKESAHVGVNPKRGGHAFRKRRSFHAG